jgi:hypothetical protein
LVQFCTSGAFRTFATVGRGTPGPWDAPRRFVAVGPYRWVRKPIYIGALLVLLEEAWLFLSLPLFLYAGAVAVGFHLFVIWFEEPALRAQFGDEYNGYCRTVSPWIPRPPQRKQSQQHVLRGELQRPDFVGPFASWLPEAEAREIRAHAANCAKCESALRQKEDVQRRLGLLRTNEPRIKVAERVADRLKQTERRNPLLRSARLAGCRWRSLRPGWW